MEKRGPALVNFLYVVDPFTRVVVWVDSAWRGVGAMVGNVGAFGVLWKS
jgi:hypothetical protein